MRTETTPLASPLSSASPLITALTGEYARLCRRGKFSATERLELGLKKERKRKKISEEWGEAASAGDHHETTARPGGLDQPAARLVCGPGGELVRGASTPPRQMFPHTGAVLFFKRLFQAGSSPLPSTDTFLYKQQIVLLLSFSGFGRNRNRLLQPSPVTVCFCPRRLPQPLATCCFLPCAPFPSPATTLPLPLATEPCGSICTPSCSALQVLFTRG